MKRVAMTKSFLFTSTFALGVLAIGCDSSVSATVGDGGGGSGGGSGDGTAPYTKGCAFPDAANYDPQFSPSDFSTTIDNEYFPLVPGTTFVHEDADGNGNEFEVTSDTKVILGVTCVVVHDVAKTSTGEIIEDTLDWYAQHKDGSVWYFGEDTAEYQNGMKVSTHGTWMAGTDCAKPGIIMLANPKPGDSYREEYYAGEAEDEADVVSVTEVVEVIYNTQDAATGTYTGSLKTKNYTKLEPNKVENKWYAPGIGEIRSQEVVTVGTGKVEELVSITHK
jgi:hypothetical protein